MDEERQFVEVKLAFAEVTIAGTSGLSEFARIRAREQGIELTGSSATEAAQSDLLYDAAENKSLAIAQNGSNPYQEGVPEESDKSIAALEADRFDAQQSALTDPTDRVSLQDPKDPIVISSDLGGYPSRSMYSDAQKYQSTPGEAALAAEFPGAQLAQPNRVLTEAEMQECVGHFKSLSKGHCVPRAGITGGYYDYSKDEEGNFSIKDSKTAVVIYQEAQGGSSVQYSYLSLSDLAFTKAALVPVVRESSRTVAVEPQRKQ